MRRIVLASLTILCLSFTVFLIGFKISVEGSSELPVHNIDTGLNYATIQEAINAATPGNVIYVDNGTYYENVVVNKRVSLIGENKFSTIVDGKSDKVKIGIKITASNVTLSGFTVRTDPGGTGILVSGKNCLISGNIAKNSYKGISLYYSRDSTVSGNIMRNNFCGIYVDHSHRCFISLNNATKNEHNGIWLSWSSNNEISKNAITDNRGHGYGTGLLLMSSSRNNITENTVINNDYGITLSYSSEHNILRNNNMTGNGYNFGVQDRSFINDIDVSNTVNGKPIIYLIDRHHMTIDQSTYSAIGYLGLVNSDRITIRNLNLTHNGNGILLAYTDYSTIENVSVSNNFHGIILAHSPRCSIKKNIVIKNNIGMQISSSDHCTINENYVTKNGYDGINVKRSNHCTIRKNTVTSNNPGISLTGSDHCIINGNNITKNHYGIKLEAYSHGFGMGGILCYHNIITGNNVENNDRGIKIAGDDNIIYHNNFIDNRIQVKDTYGENRWDYGRIGNYWSDYDGIGDMPYIIDKNNQDNYPLMYPISPKPELSMLILKVIVAIALVIVSAWIAKRIVMT